MVDRVAPSPMRRRAGRPRERTATRTRILAAATELFGSRGMDAVSLDEIAAVVGVRKQTLLYWFPSRDELLSAVASDAAVQLIEVMEAAARAAPDAPLARIDAVVRAVFRAGVRRRALLGLLRDLGRMPVSVAGEVTARMAPLAGDAVAWLEREMAAGRVRRGDPRLVLSIVYSTVVGIATEPRALDALGWREDVAELRRLRRELRAFLHAALAPG